MYPQMHNALRAYNVTLSDLLVLGAELRMRPLVAHCHLGLGKLYLRTDEREQVREHLATATTMYRELGMTYWLEKAGAEERIQGERTRPLTPGPVVDPPRPLGLPAADLSRARRVGGADEVSPVPAGNAIRRQFLPEVPAWADAQDANGKARLGRTRDDKEGGHCRLHDG